ncbi:hypothetical protein C8Q77DRAFT_1096655 [Trametes polyzona]|nr:hypothetical protein C8Q77DRAFT_1096655 [Trametes polyzona]
MVLGWSAPYLCTDADLHAVPLPSQRYKYGGCAVVEDAVVLDPTGASRLPGGHAPAAFPLPSVSGLRTKFLEAAVDRRKASRTRRLALTVRPGAPEGTASIFQPGSTVLRKVSRRSGRTTRTMTGSGPSQPGLQSFLRLSSAFPPAASGIRSIPRTDRIWHQLLSRRKASPGPQRSVGGFSRSHPSSQRRRAGI